jgi:hypothetical protein
VRSKLTAIGNATGATRASRRLPSGVDAGVHQLDELADPLGGAGAAERVNTAATRGAGAPWPQFVKP